MTCGDDGLMPVSTSEAALTIISTAETKEFMAGPTDPKVKLFCWCTPVDAVPGPVTTTCQKHPAANRTVKPLATHKSPTSSATCLLRNFAC